jgi:dihydropteroate synthase
MPAACIETETKLLCKAIEMVKNEFGEIAVSADTFRAAVARSAVLSGADIINDIGGGNLDHKMFKTVAEVGVPYILMHSRGTPKTMKELSQYADVVNDVIFELSEKINRLRLLGLNDIIVDPGFGFAKTISQNFEMLARLEEFKVLDCPILVGISRKSMIWKTLGTNPEGSLNGTSVLNTLALEKGADILRVHDVKEACETIALHSKISTR